MLDCHVAEDVTGLVVLAYHPGPKPASVHTPPAKPQTNEPTLTEHFDCLGAQKWSPFE